ncbi:MAG: NAD(P)/FAD-dependent oxidoreductase [Candidatus Anstonellales archaeon]
MIEIIGAGPVGCTAAIEGLEAGERVDIYEIKKEVGEPSHCSGLLSRDGMEGLRKYINWKEHVLNRIDGAIISFGGKEIFVGREGVAYVVDRKGWDKALAQKAVDNGAKLHLGKRADHFRGNVIIGADGAFSTVARRFGFPDIKRFVRTAKGYCRWPDESIVRVYIDSRWVGLFGWVIPQGDGTAEFGIGTFGEPISSFSLFTRSIGMSAKVERMNVIPMQLREITSMEVNGRQVLLAGNAAGQVKQTTGGGVIIGMSCGAIAGKTRNSDAYEKEWRASYLKDLLLHRYIMALVRRMDNRRLYDFGVMLKALEIDTLLSKYGEMERVSKAINRNTIVQLSRLAFNAIPLLI